MGITADELRERLRERGVVGEHTAMFDEELWALAGAEATVLVVDLSGFTRQTRAHGVLHFLSVHSLSVELGQVAIKAAGGRFVKALADNFFATFADPAAGLAAGLELLRLACEVNQTLPEHAHIHPCLGLCHGRLLHLVDDIFGEPVNIAFKLGEDLARPYEFLVSSGTAPRLPETVSLSAERRSLAGHVDLVYHAVEHPYTAG